MGEGKEYYEKDYNIRNKEYRFTCSRSGFCLEAPFCEE